MLGNMDSSCLFSSNSLRIIYSGYSLYSLDEFPSDSKCINIPFYILKQGG